MTPMLGMQPERSSGIAPMGARVAPQPPPVMTPPAGSPLFAPQAIPTTPVPYPPAPSAAHAGFGMHGGAAMPMPGGSYPQPAYPQRAASPRSSTRIIWWVIVLLAIGAGVGTAVALLVSK
jgi:hypothetical protein